MRGRTAAVLLLALALLLLPQLPAEPPEEAPEQRLALVEYFTATWCPPCLPGGLALEAVADMDEVAVLAYHPLEDDPFGSAAIEERLELYDVTGFPTFVINGGSRLEGASSQSGTGEQYRQLFAANPPAEGVGVRVAAPQVANGSATLAAQATGALPEGDGWELWLVLYEDHRYWHGWDGEGNGSNGMRLHRWTVRAIAEPVPLSTEPVNRTVVLDPDWDRENLGVVAFIQHNATREVLVAGVSGPEFHRTAEEQPLPAPGALLPLLGVAALRRWRRNR
ncbi:MAG: hypothetical protein BEU05_02830 [Marine Group III euryarchaeote CG-Bathy2]|uniref:Thioredoxin domain-containing protein n=1 Tax=Marine Group III euryarchaeote CG-Bathy2 TaxID=1889002 RepID=A0A1J5T9K3_9ARCH|nr:MAG: hypothetical protein BEU05_02830 [Marine Group III euryarchaeote CG-Bathy2]